MICKTYQFTARHMNNRSTLNFTGFGLPTGEILVCWPYEYEFHEGYEYFHKNIWSVHISGYLIATIDTEIERTDEIPDETLEIFARQSAQEFGIESVPVSLRHWLK